MLRWASNVTQVQMRSRRLTEGWPTNTTPTFPKIAEGEAKFKEIQEAYATLKN